MLNECVSLLCIPEKSRKDENERRKEKDCILISLLPSVFFHIKQNEGRRDVILFVKEGRKEPGKERRSLRRKEGRSEGEVV